MTWKEHFSLEQLGESESPTPSPHKTPSWLRSHSLRRKTTSYPHLPTIMTGSFKEPLKLVKVAMPRTHPGWTSHFRPCVPKETQEARSACLQSVRVCPPLPIPSPWQPQVPQGLRGKSWRKRALRPAEILSSRVWISTQVQNVLPAVRSSSAMPLDME